MVDRIYESSAVQAPPSAPSEPSEGYPTGGNPAQGIPATRPGPYWYHMITESLREVVVAAGLEPDHLQLGRLAAAVRQAATTEKAGTVEKATTLESQEGAEDKYPDASGVHSAILANPYKAKAIGEPFALWDHLSGVTPPSNSGNAKYIKLTAGEDGPGGYNEGLLQNEVISGSFPSLQASAEVSVGPMAGQSVWLMNTMEAYLRARETSGASQQAEIESHSHSSQNAMYTSSDVQVGSGGSIRGVNNGLVSSTGSYGGNETRVKNISATYYMRIA